jgi:hypothetical protein
VVVELPVTDIVCEESCGIIIKSRIFEDCNV